MVKTNDGFFLFAHSQIFRLFPVFSYCEKMAINVLVYIFFIDTGIDATWVDV